MIKTAIILATFVFSAITGHARLGENFDQCQTLYGACQTDSNGNPLPGPALSEVAMAQIQWDSAGQIIQIGWLPPGSQGPADMVVYKKTPNHDLTEKELKTTLKQNAGEAVWQEKGGRYLRTDGATATIIAGDIIFKSAKLIRAEKELKNPPAQKSEAPPKDIPEKKEANSETAAVYKILHVILGVALIILSPFILITGINTVIDKIKSWAPAPERPSPTGITLNTLENLDWHQFELFCCYWLIAQGYQTRRTLTHEHACTFGVIDLEATHKVFAPLVAQCKNWKKPIGIKPVQEFSQAIQSSGRQGFFFATCNFDKAAIKFAKTERIRLINSKELYRVFTTFPDKTQTEIVKEVFAKPETQEIA